MTEKGVSAERILKKLDSYLHKSDYSSAERHLLYWQEDAKQKNDFRTEILVQNELMGLYRKQGRETDALECVSAVLERMEILKISEQLGAATTFLNCATVYKAFGRASESLPLFERARSIYEKELESGDKRLGGLYNNMALTLVDLERFSEAKALYLKAVSIMAQEQNTEPQIAITYLNMASAAESEYGLLDADEIIQDYLEKAKALLESCSLQDGDYAFVCEKCASVFGYYGYFAYENELKERAKRIYEGNGSV